MGHPTISPNLLYDFSFVKSIGHRSLRAGEKVRITERDISRLVSHALGYCDHAEAHMDEHGHMAVYQIVSVNY